MILECSIIQGNLSQLLLFSEIIGKFAFACQAGIMMKMLRDFVLFIWPKFKVTSNFAAENLALRQQLAIMKQTNKRLKIRMADRLFWVFSPEFGASQVLQLNLVTVLQILPFCSGNINCLSPSQFRGGPNLSSESESQRVLERIRWLQENRLKKLLREMGRQISFEKIPDIKLAYDRLKGNYQDLPAVWLVFCEKMGNRHNKKTNPHSI